MPLRAAHGRGATVGAGGSRVEVSPVDELPAGLPADARVASPSDRGPGGLFAGGNSLARRGGESKMGRSRLTSLLGLSPAGEAFAPYRKAAASFRRSECASIAASVGGGFCGPGPASIVASASLQLAWSRFLSDQASLTGDGKLALQASKLMNDHRQNLIAARELCAREAKARQGAHSAANAPWLKPLIETSHDEAEGNEA